MGLFDLFKESDEAREKREKEHARLQREKQYKKEARPLHFNYSKTANRIETKWSILRDTQDFTGQRGKDFERLCIQNIDDLRKWVEVQAKYGKELPTKAPAFKRLAMLYEKQNEYEKAASVCRMYLQLGLKPEKMDSRMVRMIKKAGRTPTEEELKIIDRL